MNSFAASYYCLETNQVVNEGDSMQKVQATCGAPTTVSIRDEMISSPMKITEWVYINRPTDPTKTENYLARLVVVFNEKGKVTQLKQSQQLVNPNGQTTVTCGVGGVKVGDDIPAVQINCGNPAFVNKFQSSEERTQKVIEWSYQKSSNLTPLVFRFENGILTQIKNG
jgi:hypothetical protein